MNSHRRKIDLARTRLPKRVIRECCRRRSHDLDEYPDCDLAQLRQMVERIPSVWGSAVTKTEKIRSLTQTTGNRGKNDEGKK